MAEDWKPVEKPPLGIMPEWRWREHRVENLEAAINRFEDAGQSDRSLLHLWREEVAQHRRWILETRELDGMN